MPTREYRRYKNDKYDLEAYSYPLDILSREHGGNYMLFNINAQGGSKLAQNKEDIIASERYSDRASLERQAKRNRGGNLQRSVEENNITSGQTTAAAFLTALFTGAAFSAVTGFSGGGTAGGVATTTGATHNTVAEGLASKVTKRLKTAILLYIPEQVTVTYNADWDTDTAALLKKASEFTNASTDDIKNLIGMGYNKLKEIVYGEKSAGPGGENYSNYDSKTKDIAKKLIDLYSFKLSPNQTGLSALTGLTPNPIKEQIFNGINFRSFNYDFMFEARNEKEAENIKNIIYQFKYHMMPEFKTNNDFLYVYPSEFDISYYHAYNENNYLHRHTTCVLTDVIVNYTPNTVWAVRYDGSPLRVNLALTFKELGLITKESVERGY